MEFLDFLDEEIEKIMDCCSCGTKYTLDRWDTIARKSINCPHRHITFTIHAYNFIKRLIIHIYDKYFNVVIYYGLYAKKHKFSYIFLACNTVL